jgi:hypothetical protein
VFVAPFVLAMFPKAGLMDFDHLNRLGPQAARGAKMGMGLVFAVAAAWTIGPRVLAMFPGIVRSSTSLKMLLPESSAVGWLTVIIAPLYGGFVLLGVVAINQVPETGKLMAGLLLMLLAPAVYLGQAKALIQPSSYTGSGSRLVLIRRASAGCNLVGTVLLVWGLLEIPGVAFGDVFAFILGMLGNILLLMVVCSDMVLPLLRWSFRQGQAFQGSDLMPALDAKYDALLPARADRAGVVRAALASDTAATEAVADALEGTGEDSVLDLKLSEAADAPDRTGEPAAAPHEQPDTAASPKAKKSTRRGTSRRRRKSED